MTSEDDARTRLRVGGWLPPYQAFPPAADRLTGRNVHRSQLPVNVDNTGESIAPVRSDRRGSAVVFCVAVAGLLLIGITGLQLGGEPATPAANSEVQLPAAPAVPPPALPLPVVGTPTPTPSMPPSSNAPGSATRGRSEVSRSPVRTTAATSAATRKPAGTAAPRPGLRIGAAVSLELAGAPGHRVRHRDFRGRTDRIGPDSPAPARADATFVVRRGLADAGCVSFEAANYPGYFLRHRDFVVRLDRAERSRLFTADATFCPETRSRAGVVALRSHNYPDRYVTESRSQLRLTPATSGPAAQFVVRPPL
jgi:hypothetical protein